LVVMDTFRYLVPGTVVQKCLKNIMGFFNEWNYPFTSLNYVVQLNKQNTNDIWIYVAK
jgi:hypothetical protein